MRNHIKRAIIPFFTMCVVLAGYNSTAQQPSKSNNTIHDRMYELMRKSDTVVLPAVVVEKINSLNVANPNRKKAIHTQTSVLQVMYNTTLSKKDIDFFGRQILKSSSASIAAINADIKKLLPQ